MSDWPESGGEHYIDEFDDPEWNGRLCPYFARYESLPGHDPEATCGFGCIDEPACVTGAPTGGWPPLDAAYTGHGALCPCLSCTAVAVPTGDLL